MVLHANEKIKRMIIHVKIKSKMLRQRQITNSGHPPPPKKKQQLNKTNRGFFLRDKPTIY